MRRENAAISVGAIDLDEWRGGLQLRRGHFEVLRVESLAGFDYTIKLYSKIIA